MYLHFITCIFQHVGDVPSVWMHQHCDSWYVAFFLFAGFGTLFFPGVNFQSCGPEGSRSHAWCNHHQSVCVYVQCGSDRAGEGGLEPHWFQNGQWWPQIILSQCGSDPPPPWTIPLQTIWFTKILKICFCFKMISDDSLIILSQCGSAPPPSDHMVHQNSWKSIFSF